jgi:inorganic pyrophosphatase
MKIFFYLIFFSQICYANPINIIEYKKNDLYSFYVEIPAGTLEKWEVDKESGELEWEEKNGKKRIINFLPFPGNYGFIPQTLAGDNDPIDLIMIDAAKERGSLNHVRVIGGLYFEDKKELDILKIWFGSYKKPGKMIFFRFLDHSKAINYIEEAHLRWNKAQSDKSK